MDCTSREGEKRQDEIKRAVRLQISSKIGIESLRIGKKKECVLLGR
jgi:hypothetical protein